MQIEFATCCRKTALYYIRKVFPDRTVEDTPDDAGPLLDLVEKDVVRVRDPAMYGSRIGVVPSTNWPDDIRRQATDAAMQIQNHK